jgi:hypothetical protein
VEQDGGPEILVPNLPEKPAQREADLDGRQDPSRPLPGKVVGCFRHEEFVKPKPPPLPPDDPPGRFKGIVVLREVVGLEGPGGQHRRRAFARPYHPGGLAVYRQHDM